MANTAVVFYTAVFFKVQQQGDAHAFAQRQAEGLGDQDAINLGQSGSHRRLTRQQHGRKHKRAGGKQGFQQHIIQRTFHIHSLNSCYEFHSA
ncbi:hypothetical protein D3C80_665500 [compost metagenome]